MNGFGKYHPTVTGLYFMAVMIIAMFVRNPIIQVFALTGGAAFCLLKEKRQFGKSIGFYAILFLLVTVTNPLFSHNGVTPLFFINENPITLEAVIYGSSLGIMIISVIIWFRCFNTIMTSDKIIFLFGRTIPKLSLVLSMALRFIPMFIRRARKVSESRKAIGLYSSDSIIGRVREQLRVFSSVIAWAFENAIDTSASMRARGYSTGVRTSFSLYTFKLGDGLMLILICVAVAVCVIGFTIGATEFSYYPQISRINTSLFAITAYSAYGILSFIPFIIELKEALIWKFYVWKI